MNVKPAPGVKVRCPVTKQFIPDDGYKVNDHDLYWARRLRDKDVVLVDELAAESKDEKGGEAL